jgi:hypothetical protein
MTTEPSTLTFQSDLRIARDDLWARITDLRNAGVRAGRGRPDHGLR